MNTIEKIIAGMESQKNGYLEILAKAEEQLEAVDAGNVSRTLGLAEEKAVLLDRLRETESNLAEARVGLSEPDKAEAKRRTGDLAIEIQSTLEKIIAIEDSCEKSLRSAKSDLKQKMAALREGKAMIKNYGRDDGSESKLSKKV